MCMYICLKNIHRMDYLFIYIFIYFINTLWILCISLRFSRVSEPCVLKMRHATCGSHSALCLYDVQCMLQYMKRNDQHSAIVQNGHTHIYYNIQYFKFKRMTRDFLNEETLYIRYSFIPSHIRLRTNKTVYTLWLFCQNRCRRLPSSIPIRMINPLPIYALEQE